MTKFRKNCMLLGVAFAALTQGQLAHAQTAPTAEEGGEIIVTANKREQNINDVGLTITALSSESIADRKITSLADVAAAVPGLAYSPSTTNTPIFTLRGVGFNESSLGVYPAVSVYADEVPMPFPVTASHAAYDLERIEVLKGPQGTLFGQNSTGGAINYIVAKPTESFEAGGDIGYGRFNTIEGNAYISGPLGNTVAARLAVTGLNSDDWQKSNSRPNDTNGKQSYVAGRLLLDFKPSDGLRFSLNLNGWRDKSDPQAQQMVAVRPQVPAIATATNLAGLASAQFSPRNARAADWSTGVGEPRGDRKFYQASLRMDADVTDDITFTSLTSYNDYKQTQATDGDGLPLGEVWRVALENGTPERVAGGFDIPTAVKWDASGRLFVVESGSGAVSLVDPVAGTKSEHARVAFGIDNFAFSPDGRLFVSHFTDGGVVEIAPDGSQRQAVAGGMCGPFGMACNAAGNLVAADGMSFAIIDPQGSIRRLSMLLQHGFPGYVRGVAVAGDGSLLSTNSAGQVSRYEVGAEAVPLFEGLDEAMGITCGADGAVLVCEAGGGRVLAINAKGEATVLASGLDRPTGVAALADGSIAVSESGAGRVIRIANGESASMLDGLAEPHGVTVSGGTLYALDRGTQSLHAVAVGGGGSTIVATGLPVGAHSGMKVNILPGIAGLMPGPLSPFADIAALPGGRIAIGGDETGSVLTVGKA